MIRFCSLFLSFPNSILSVFGSFDHLLVQMHRYKPPIGIDLESQETIRKLLLVQSSSPLPPVWAHGYLLCNLMIHLNSLVRRILHFVTLPLCRLKQCAVLVIKKAQFSIRTKENWALPLLNNFINNSNEEKILA